MDNMQRTIQTKVCGISDIGLVRQNNEDVWAELPEIRLYILADGMGGHQAGEVAARETVKTLCRILQKSFKDNNQSLEEAAASIRKAIGLVNTHIYKMGKSVSNLKGMGTTLCVLHIHQEGVIYAHVGDSRIYRMLPGKFELITKDHSLLRELIDIGQISEDKVAGFHYKNIITRAIGTEPFVEVSDNIAPLVPQVRYVLCSDGLSDLISIAEMQHILTETETLSEAALQLVSLSKIKGGNDNVTVLIIDVQCRND